jgi:hypothetical protein
LYRDESELFTLYKDLTQHLPSKPLQTGKKQPVSPRPENDNSQVISQSPNNMSDDIDNELYGDDSVVEDTVAGETDSAGEKEIDQKETKVDENEMVEMQMEDSEKKGEHEKEEKEGSKVDEHNVSGVIEDETKATFWVVALRIDGGLEVSIFTLRSAWKRFVLSLRMGHK